MKPVFGITVTTVDSYGSLVLPTERETSWRRDAGLSLLYEQKISVTLQKRLCGSKCCLE